MQYPGTGPGTGYQMVGAGDPNDPNHKKQLQDYLLGKLQASPGTAGSYASISGQATGAPRSSTNPFLAMLSGRPGETFQDLQGTGLTAPQAAQGQGIGQGIGQPSAGQQSYLAPPANSYNAPAGQDSTPTHYYDTFQPGRDGQTATGTLPGAPQASIGTAMIGGPSGGGGILNPGVQLGDSTYQAQVSPSMGMSIAGLDPTTQAALMYHIGVMHGQGSQL